MSQPPWEWGRWYRGGRYVDGHLPALAPAQPVCRGCLMRSDTPSALVDHHHSAVAALLDEARSMQTIVPSLGPTP